MAGAVKRAGGAAWCAISGVLALSACSTPDAREAAPPEGVGRAAGTPESQQPQCDTRAAVLDVLARKYEERPVALGVTANGGLLEVLSTDGGATWSIIVTTPTGWACLVADGEGWRQLDPEPAGERS